MNKFAILGSFALFLIAPTYAMASARELSQEELRNAVEAGQVLGLSSVLQMVQTNVEGEPVDVRAFDASGLCYSILILLPDGRLVRVVVDAETGTFLPPTSERANEVRAAASASKSKKIKLPDDASPSANGNAPSHSNAGGNGKGKAKGKDKDKGKGKGKNK